MKYLSYILGLIFLFSCGQAPSANLDSSEVDENMIQGWTVYQDPETGEEVWNEAIIFSSLEALKQADDATNVVSDETSVRAKSITINKVKFCSGHWDNPNNYQKICVFGSGSDCYATCPNQTEQ